MMDFKKIEAEAIAKAIVEQCNLIEEFSSYTQADYLSSDGKLDGFHANDATVLKYGDEYLFGIRANTFVIEIGWHEYYDGAAFLVSANHKGNRVQKLYIEKGAK